ncbi:hypothetical protein MJM45_31930, partial [Salmonella enterica subsp. enterica serovar Kentucky]|nr:hypothetical protein [Salmonella enterica subsp. enterica serovar Kentucky]
KLNQLMAWLEDHFAEEVCWEAVAEQFSLPLRTLHRQLKQHTGGNTTPFSTDFTITIDTQAPAAPGVIGVADGDGNTIDTNQITQ